MFYRPSDWLRSLLRRCAVIVGPAALIGSARAVNILYEAIFIQVPVYLSALTEDIIRNVLTQ